MRYLKYRLRTKLLHLLGRPIPAEFADDDFDWRAYSTHYAEELKEMEQGYLTRLAPEDYLFAEGILTRQSSARGSLPHGPCIPITASCMKRFFNWHRKA